MYYSVELIRPLFNSIYNVFASGLTASSKQVQISFLLKQAVLMIDGFENHVGEVTPEQAQTELKTVNDLLLKFSGIANNLPTDSEVINEVTYVRNKLNEVKAIFEKAIDKGEFKKEQQTLNRYNIDTWGGEDKDYEPFLKMKRYGV